MSGLRRSLLLAAMLLLAAGPQNLFAQDGYRPQDVVTLERSVRFRPGTSSAVMRNTIRAGQLHWYKVRAREGQEMTVMLRTKGRTSFTLYTPDSPIEDADGVLEWRGELPQSGEYLIQVATDNTAAYTLEVWIK
jgi:hypothetical protein